MHMMYDETRECPPTRLLCKEHHVISFPGRDGATLGDVPLKLGVTAFHTPSW